MKTPTRNLIVRLLLMPGVVALIFSWYVQSRFVEPDAADRLTVRGEPAASALQLPCRVLVWNIYKGDRPEFSADMQALSEDCDLLLIQEYHANQRVKGALDQLATHAFQIVTSFLYRTDQSATGVATGASASALGSECLITSDTELIAGTPKSMLICRYKVADSSDQLLVINIHAINVAGVTAFRNQLEQLREVLESHAGPIVFAGDFNTNTRSKQEQLRAFADEFDLVEMQFEADTRTRSPLIELPIDYVFTRGLLTSQHGVAGDRDGSDHKALTFRIDQLTN